MLARLRGLVARRRGDDEIAAECAALIVGLGNPGNEYSQNRHNVGFWCLNRIARRSGVDFTQRGKLAAVAEGYVAARPAALAKPRTFVNQSGRAVAELLKRYRLTARELIVVCDDLDRPVGALRIRGGGGHGGHNGLRSIIASLQTDEFARVRIGIGRPSVDGVPTRDPERVAAWVLADPSAGERQEIVAAVDLAVDAVDVVLQEGLERAMAKFNARGDTTKG